MITADLKGLAAYNHPAHYNNGAIECIDALKSALTTEQYQGFLLGNALKYIWRAGTKVPPGVSKHAAALSDINKSVWYMERYLEEFSNE